MSTCQILSSVALVVIAASAGCSGKVTPEVPGASPARVAERATSAPQARGALEDGRATTKAFFAGETHALWERFAAPLRAKVGDEPGLAKFRESADRQLGASAGVVSERVEQREGLDLYVCIARFERTSAPIKIVIGFDPNHHIAAFAIVPETAMEAAPSTRLDYRTRAALRLPFTGAWNVAWGGRTIEQNQHAAVINQRFAYDFLVTENGLTHRGDGTRNEDYFAYGRPVLAPAAGTVLAVANDVPENIPGHMGAITLAGNYVMIDHGNGEVSLLAHLVPGSVTVKMGDRVAAGQRLGACGNSGHSSEPHLHYHLQDSPKLGSGEGLPAPFHGYVANGTRVVRGEPVRGERIESAPEDSATTKKLRTLAR